MSANKGELFQSNLSWEWPRQEPLAQQGGPTQWMYDLIDNPDLDVAADLLEALVPEAREPYGAFQQKKKEQEQAKPPQAMAQKPKNIWNPISNILFYAAMAAIVLGAVIFSSNTNGSSQFFGFRYFEVLTGSMESVIPQGSLVVTQKVASNDIEVGDVITYIRSDEETVTHEVIEIIPNFNDSGSLGFQTKGTENPNPDPDIVAAANVLGLVKWHVKGVGFFLRYVKDNIKYVFVLFILVILISIALRVLLGDKDGKNKLGLRLRRNPAVEGITA